MNDAIYAVGVQFISYGTWTKEYTYKSDKPFQEGDAVVVPTGNWFSLGRVTWCKDNYPFRKDIASKTIKCMVPL